jgi:hypothetical protein
MDLTLRRWLLGALIAVAPCGSGCGDDPASYSSDALLLPATVTDAYRFADALAREWAQNAFVTSMGGTFAVMDSLGRARNHSFVFHARDGAIHRRLSLHLIDGTPWMNDVIVPEPPPRFVQVESLVDSDAVIGLAINLAQLANEAKPDSIPVPVEFAARLLSVPVFPEPGTDPDPNTEVAWRVDFLELDVLESSNSLVYWSTARFYFEPYAGTLLGEPVLPPSGRELYPFP